MIKMILKRPARALCTLAMLILPALAPAGETTGLSDSEIRIGVMGPFSGNAASYSKATLGLMAYYDKVNAEGGVHGRKLVAVREDTGCDTAKGLAALKKLLYQDEVFMLHGNSCSGVAMALRPEVEAAGLP